MKKSIVLEGTMEWVHRHLRRMRLEDGPIVAEDAVEDRALMMYRADRKRRKRADKNSDPKTAQAKADRLLARQLDKDAEE